MKINLKSSSTLFLMISLAILIAVVMIKIKAPVDHQAMEMPRKTVSAITAKLLPFRASVTAYGNVEAAINLHSIAEVSGKISYLHPALKAGETIPANTLVARIETKDYAVALRQAEADLAANRSALKELNEEEKTTLRSLSLAQKNLDFGEAEYVRIKDIYQKKLVSKSTLDAEEQKVIQLRQQVEELQGKENIYTSRRQSVNAQIIRAEQTVQKSKTVLGRTEIRVPFDARIGDVNIEKNEFVSVGTLLFEAIDLKGVEITAQLPLTSMRKLLSHLADPNRLEDQPVPSDQVIGTGGNINDRLQLGARVRLVNNMPDAIWDAKVLRISDSIDVTRQTLGIVVGVDDPYKKAIPGRRPPLIRGMYTAVELYAPSHPALVVPRKAVHQGRIYIAKSDNSLEIRKAKILVTQNNLAIIESGLKVGERIILTDLIPIIDGMPLEVVPDTESEKALRLQAAGYPMETE